jgi:hypothetical protein
MDARDVVDKEANVALERLAFKSGEAPFRSIAWTTNTSLSNGLSWRSTLSSVSVFAADSVNEAETWIGLDVDLSPLGIAYHDSRRVIVIVETLESLTYHGNRWFSGY